MNSGRFSKGFLFEAFVTSVLRQIASAKNQEIFFDSRIPMDLLASKAGDRGRFDAIAPNGFDNISGFVVFEFKFFQQNVEYDKLRSTLNGLYKRLVQLTFSEVTLILVTNVDVFRFINIEQDIGAKVPYKGQIDFEIWGQDVIDRWIDRYPIDYSNIQNLDTFPESRAKGLDITEADFAKKSQNNLVEIKNIIKKRDNFALVLGAGVSVDPGAKTWDKLLDFFTDKLKRAGIIDDEKRLKKKIGGSSIITAQLCKELYPNDLNYYWEIHQGLYQNRQAIDPNFALYHIACIVSACTAKAHFRVLTYNYDNYLESYLDNIHVPYNTLYDSESDVNERISIYHVHGYLPEVKFKTHIQPGYRKSIYLTEEDYNELYNHPYSWQISSQLSFFRENTCLFVGCSLADPNIRRLLEMTKKENRIHYAILTMDGMTTNDLVKASNHFARIGIEVIWARDYKDVSKKLEQLYL